ncbi:bifunctional 2',3'-cyclic-nucleotide 2'-phosphodiesterase/3'-nucleotidase [Roseinatronobacter alkalisoli]|uniref:Bifunctional 2',3'-cyclic-nucleotide 2'-phosphodiesterase/3'-nucleotidase n=1 Tax=Roseinatronobacter alkalisoli TaxID=3028235 RepID=A0ABT5T6B2_9RHOB|nr:bifunctional 2',3'-cyclic-nucleotide 2'-phosphodiesterase/3'-nucleotidase [Roseinatronobacter sp. HJB301]MDD7970584.1 bifunctional 2',3'-cyclic-nucleotide 2'-phosphodiesterase/3'-nucleotidase [Roseinatronobacter sp. HJB301]
MGSHAKKGVMGQERWQFAPITEVSSTVDLRIMETTDLHVHLHPYDYYADCPNPDLGLVRLSELVDQARMEVPNCLLFDNGDFLQGTPVGDFFAYDRGLKEGDLHPVMAAMNAMRYDAITLGNHEFNYGLDFLMKSLAHAEFPVVSANIVKSLGAGPRDDRCLVRPYKLIRRRLVDRAGLAHDICVGVIGVAPPQITVWERLHLHNRIQMRDMVASAAAWVPEMREAGADLVVMLAHTGIGPLRHSDGMENAIIPLARIDGVDLILSGHSHQVFPSRAFADIPGVDIDKGTICGKPTVMSGFFGSHLGVIDLRMVREGGRWRVIGSQVENRALRDASMSFLRPEQGQTIQPMRSPKVRRIVARAHDMVLENIRQPIGQTLAPINSFFVFLGHSASTALVADAQRAFVARRLQGSEYDGLPVLSSVSPSKAGGLGGPRNYTNVAAGALTIRSLADLYTYPNRIAALKLTGAQIACWLERSASCYNRLHDGLEDEMLLNPAHPSYNFEIVYGLEYDIDLTQPARFEGDGTLVDSCNTRVRNLRWNGRPIDPQAAFILCTNSFRAHGAGGFAGAVPQNVVLEDPAITRDILREYVRSRGNLDIDPQGPFGLQFRTGKSAILRTGPAAYDHIGAISHFAPEVAGVDKKGFMRLRVQL